MKVYSEILSSVLFKSGGHHVGVHYLDSHVARSRIFITGLISFIRAVDRENEGLCCQHQRFGCLFVHADFARQLGSCLSSIDRVFFLAGNVYVGYVPFCCRGQRRAAEE